MASHNPYTLYVNQKLAFVRFHMSAARDNLSVDDLQHRLATHACLDAALHQLYEALLLYVREIAVQLDVPADFSSHNVSALVERHRSVPELGELANLFASQSWLSQFLQAYRDNDFVVRQFNDATNEKSSELSENTAITASTVIPALQVGADLPLDLIESWSHSLQSLVDRQRENMVEE